MSGKSDDVERAGEGAARGSASGSALLRSAFAGDLDGIRAALAKGADVDFLDPQTGLAALHIAIGTNDLEACRMLIEEHGAAIAPDRSGRWPSLIAAQCRVDDDLSDFIVEAEAAFLASGRRGN